MQLLYCDLRQDERRIVRVLAGLERLLREGNRVYHERRFKGVVLGREEFEVLLERGVLRMNLQGLAPGGQGLLVPGLPLLEVAEVAEHFGMLRADTEAFLKQVDPLPELPVVCQQERLLPSQGEARGLGANHRVVELEGESLVPLFQSLFEDVPADRVALPVGLEVLLVRLDRSVMVAEGLRNDSDLVIDPCDIREPLLERPDHLPGQTPQRTEGIGIGQHQFRREEVRIGDQGLLEQLHLSIPVSPRTVVGRKTVERRGVGGVDLESPLEIGPLLVVID